MDLSIHLLYFTGATIPSNFCFSVQLLIFFYLFNDTEILVQNVLHWHRLQRQL